MNIDAKIPKNVDVLTFDPNPFEPIVFKKIEEKVAKSTRKAMLFGYYLTSPEASNYLRTKGFCCLTNQIIGDIQYIGKELDWANLSIFFSYAIINYFAVRANNDVLLLESREIDELNELVRTGPCSRKSLETLGYLISNMEPTYRVTEILRDLHTHLSKFSEEKLVTFRKFNIWKLANYHYHVGHVGQLMGLENFCADDFETQLTYQFKVSVNMLNSLGDSSRQFDQHVAAEEQKRLALICHGPISTQIFSYIQKEYTEKAEGKSFGSELKDKYSEIKQENLIYMPFTLSNFVQISKKIIEAKNFLKQRQQTSQARIKLQLLYFLWFSLDSCIQEQQAEPEFVELQVKKFKDFHLNKSFSTITIPEIENFQKMSTSLFARKSLDLKNKWKILCESGMAELSFYDTMLSYLSFINSYRGDFISFANTVAKENERWALLEICRNPNSLNVKSCTLKFGKEKLHLAAQSFLGMQGFTDISQSSIISMQILPVKFRWMNVKQLLNYAVVSIIPFFYESPPSLSFSGVSGLAELTKNGLFSRNFLEKSERLIEGIKQKNPEITRVLTLLVADLKTKSDAELMVLADKELFNLPVWFYSATTLMNLQYQNDPAFALQIKNHIDFLSSALTSFTDLLKTHHSSYMEKFGQSVNFLQHIITLLAGKKEEGKEDAIDFSYFHAKFEELKISVSNFNKIDYLEQTTLISLNNLSNHPSFKKLTSNLAENYNDEEIYRNEAQDDLIENLYESFFEFDRQMNNFEEKLRPTINLFDSLTKEFLNGVIQGYRVISTTPINPEGGVYSNYRNARAPLSLKSIYFSLASSENSIETNRNWNDFISNITYFSNVDKFTSWHFRSICQLHLSFKNAYEKAVDLIQENKINSIDMARQSYFIDTFVEEGKKRRKPKKCIVPKKSSPPKLEEKSSPTEAHSQFKIEEPLMQLNSTDLMLTPLNQVLDSILAELGKLKFENAYARKSWLSVREVYKDLVAEVLGHAAPLDKANRLMVLSSLLVEQILTAHVLEDKNPATHTACLTLLSHNSLDLLNQLSRDKKIKDSTKITKNMGDLEIFAREIYSSSKKSLGSELLLQLEELRLNPASQLLPEEIVQKVSLFVYQSLSFLNETLGTNKLADLNLLKEINFDYAATESPRSGLETEIIELTEQVIINLKEVVCLEKLEKSRGVRSAQSYLADSMRQLEFLRMRLQSGGHRENLRNYFKIIASSLSLAIEKLCLALADQKGIIELDQFNPAQFDSDLVSWSTKLGLPELPQETKTYLKRSHKLRQLARYCEFYKGSLNSQVREIYTDLNSINRHVSFSLDSTAGDWTLPNEELSKLRSIVNKLLSQTKLGLKHYFELLQLLKN